MAAKKKAQMSSSRNSSFNFEHAMNELEALVEKMEHGEYSLEDSLKDFERGIELTRLCQKSLLTAEQKVQILMEQNGQQQLSPFEEE